MYKSHDQMQNTTVEGPRNGHGYVHFTHILEAAELPPSCGMFARLTLEPGAMVGEHMHTDDAEIYYILKGTMEVNDNGVIRTVEAGDVIYTSRDESHSIRNTGHEDAEMLAVILR